MNVIKVLYIINFLQYFYRMKKYKIKISYTFIDVSQALSILCRILMELPEGITLNTFDMRIKLHCTYIIVLCVIWVRYHTNEAPPIGAQSGSPIDNPQIKREIFQAQSWAEISIFRVGGVRAQLSKSNVKFSKSNPELKFPFSGWGGGGSDPTFKIKCEIF